jgi:hypothetical protein
MRESRTYGSVRGALSNGCPYRVKIAAMRMSAFGTKRTCRGDPLLVRFRGGADIREAVVCVSGTGLTQSGHELPAFAAMHGR